MPPTPQIVDSAATAPSARATGRRCRILAVDDIPTNLLIIREIVEDRHEVHCARSGLEAVAMALRLRPDLVLLDIMMPGIDGYETCRRLRSERGLAHTKIIMVSAKAMIAERLEAYESGADDYITKPFDHEEFLAKLDVYARLNTVEAMDALKTGVLELIGRGTRTPIHALVASSELLLAEGAMSVDERRRLARSAHREARRLHDLVTDVMHLTALKAGRWDLEPSATDVEPILDAVAAKAAADGVSIEVLRGTTPCPPILADADELESALAGLVGAAWCLAAGDRKVVIRAQADGPWAAIEARFAHPSVPPDALAGIFDPLGGRLPGIESGDFRLAIAAETARAMGGSAEARLADDHLEIILRLPRAIGPAAD